MYMLLRKKFNFHKKSIFSKKFFNIVSIVSVGVRNAVAYVYTNGAKRRRAY